MKESDGLAAGAFYSVGRFRFLYPRDVCFSSSFLAHRLPVCDTRLSAATFFFSSDLIVWRAHHSPFRMTLRKSHFSRVIRINVSSVSMATSIYTTNPPPKWITGCVSRRCVGRAFTWTPMISFSSSRKPIILTCPYLNDRKFARWWKILKNGSKVKQQLSVTYTMSNLLTRIFPKRHLPLLLVLKMLVSVKYFWCTKNNLLVFVFQTLVSIEHVVRSHPYFQHLWISIFHRSTDKPSTEHDFCLPIESSVAMERLLHGSSSLQQMNNFVCSSRVLTSWWTEHLTHVLHISIKSTRSMQWKMITVSCFLSHDFSEIKFVKQVSYVSLPFCVVDPLRSTKSSFRFSLITLVVSSWNFVQLKLHPTLNPPLSRLYLNR